MSLSEDRVFAPLQSPVLYRDNTWGLLCPDTALSNPSNPNKAMNQAVTFRGKHIITCKYRIRFTVGETEAHCR